MKYDNTNYHQVNGSVLSLLYSLPQVTNYCGNFGDKALDIVEVLKFLAQLPLTFPNQVSCACVCMFLV